MIFPSVHSNGTGKDGLKKLYLKAYDDLHDALGSLIAASPHGRDYYTQEPNALDIAVKEHQSRIDKLHSVLDDLGEFGLHLGKA